MGGAGEERFVAAGVQQRTLVQLVEAAAVVITYGQADAVVIGNGFALGPAGVIQMPAAIIGTHQRQRHDSAFVKGTQFTERQQHAVMNIQDVERIAGSGFQKIDIAKSRPGDGYK